MDKRVVTIGDLAFTAFLPWLCVFAANCGDNLVAWAGFDPLDWNFHPYATSLTSAGLVAGLILWTGLRNRYSRFFDWIDHALFGVGPYRDPSPSAAKSTGTTHD